MKISIIVPYHGEKQFLPDCLDSLRDLIFKDFEVVLVCDHCKVPNKIIKEHGQGLDIQVKELESEKTGVAAARNCGMDAARGEYIYFLDCDDYLYRGALAVLVDVMEKKEAETGEELQMVYGRKVTSWFRRSVFVPILDERIAKKEQEQLENAEEQESNIDAEDAEGIEEGSDEEMEAEESGEDKTEESQKKQKIYSLEIEEPFIPYRKRTAINRLILKQGIKNISVLNILFLKKFLVENDIRFGEEYVFYADVTFLVKAIQNATNFLYSSEAIYIKRSHNDPVHEPALSQITGVEKFPEYMRCFEESRKLIPENGILDYIMIRKLVSFYCDSVMQRLRHGNAEVWHGERYAYLQKLFRTFDERNFKPLKKYRKRAIKTLLHKDSKASLKVSNRHLAKKKVSKVLHKKGEMSRYLYMHEFLKKPIKEKVVVFESFFGKSYSDSPKYVYEYLMKHYKNLGYRCVWSYSDKKFDLPYGGKQVKRFGLEYMYYMATAKYFVFNVRQPYWYKKREGQVFLETWHGTPLKKLFFDMEEVYSASRLSKKQVYRQSKEWDFLIAPNLFSSKVFRSCFAFENEMLETGYPRNDVMHAPDREQIAERIRTRLSIPKDKKTILYAPTWRDDEYYGKGKYKFTLQLDLQRMKKELGNEYVILLRTHYYIADSLDVTGVEDFAINVSKYNDISELYLISDILITDYSSVFFDYANLKRPMLFFTYDLEKYRDVLRGFYINMEEELPGPILKTNDEVMEAFRNLPQIIEENKEKYEVFYEKYCGLENGHASEKVVKRMFGLK